MEAPMFTQSTNINEIVSQIKALPRAAEDIVMILIGEATDIEIPELIAALNEEQITFMGGFFPGVIFRNNRYDAGIAVDVYPSLAAPILIKDLNNLDFSINPLTKLKEVLPVGDDVQPTLLVFVDAFTTHIQVLLSRTFQIFRNRVSYIGSGAGSGSFQQKPSIFDNSGVHQDAAVIGLLNIGSKIGVRHGWRDLRGPFLANRTNRTIVQQLGYKPAFEQYSKVLKLITGITLTKENFFEVAKSYPLGINQDGFDRIVRMPVDFTDDGGIVCVGEVPTNALVSILQGDPTNLVTYAQYATQDVLKGEKPLEHCLIVDCFGRVLYLQDQFKLELDTILEAIPDGSNDPIGLLSLGEIGSFATGNVELFNATIVVSGMSKQTDYGLTDNEGQLIARAK